MTDLAGVKDKDLLQYTRAAIFKYGSYVNEQRAIPDYRDGFKPVHRRTMWAMKHMPREATGIKTARVVGEILGKYHPHGDMPVQGAITTLVHSPNSPLIGKGNWGTALDNAAAMRYTNVLLSNYGDTFLQADYLAVSDFVPNYEDREVEPVILPALLPNILLNGTDGIAFGTVCHIPSYSLKSVLPLLIKRLKQKIPLELNDFLDLEFKFAFGGSFLDTKDNRKALKHFYKTGEGSVKFFSRLQISKDKKEILFRDFPPDLGIDGSVRRISALPGVKRCVNTTDKKSASFTIQFGKVSEPEYEKLLLKIRALTTSQKSFKVNLTERTKNEQGVDVRQFSSTVPDLFEMWLKWRLELEKKCLQYRITRQKKDIAYSNLLIQAIDNIEVVMRALKEDDSEAYLVKHLKITHAQATTLMDLSLRQLKKLNKVKLTAKLTEEKEALSRLSKWLEKPAQKVGHDFERILTKIEEEK
jgi:DNA gyrase/topoisomerase IV subunit A